MKTFSKVPGNEESRIIPCPVCGASSFVPHWAYRHFAFVRCTDCGLLYQNPQPQQSHLTERYDEEYFTYERSNEDAFFELMRLGLQDLQFDRIVGTPDGPGALSVLDVGCATGRLLEWFAGRGWSVQGVEVCRPAAEYGSTVRGVPIHVGTLEHARLPSDHYDVVHCSHLLEHLTDPSTFLAEVRRVLKPAGWFVATTPNVAGFQARLFRSRWRSAIADHMVLYSRRTLGLLLKSAGFEVCRTKTWGGLGAGTAPAVIKRVFDRLAKPLGFGDVMIVLARQIGCEGSNSQSDGEDQTRP